MAVNFLDLVDSLRREINPPGSDLYPDATDDDFLGALTDSFWELRIHGLLADWQENAAARGGPVAFGEAIITPIAVTDPTYDDPSGWADSDMGRELQQLVVLWAGWKIALNRMSSLNTLFRARAGAVEYETQHAATVLKGVIDQLKSRIDTAITQLQDTASSIVLDAVIERSYAVAVGDTWWIRA